MAQDPQRDSRQTYDRPDIDLTRDDPAEMRRAQREETQEAFAVAPAGVAITPAQAKGGISGGLAGALVGGLVGALIGLLPLFDLSVGLRIAIIAGVCAVSGSTVGALLGGFFNPDREGLLGLLTLSPPHLRRVVPRQVEVRPLVGLVRVPLGVLCHA